MKTTLYQYQIPFTIEHTLSLIAAQNGSVFHPGFRSRINGNLIEIKYHAGNRNSWNPVFSGLLSEVGDKTILAGHFETPLFTTIFIHVWRGGIILMIFPLLIAAFFSHTNSANPAALLVPAGMLVFSVFLERYGISLGKQNQQKIIDFFVTNLQAEKMPDNL